jgi:AcrR family transcriptional regulator
MSTRHTQQIILDAAVELFNQWGTPEISTNRVAAYCGVSRGHLHYHFHTKQELIQCILARLSNEMAARWQEDLSHPTMVRLAEMFARQALLTQRYRFFFREQAYLLRIDPQLRQRYRDVVQRRVKALEGYFLELDRLGELCLGSDRELVRSLVRGTWIIADNWLNSVEFLEQDAALDAIAAGYELILDIFQPYLGNERHVRQISRIAIVAQIEAHATVLDLPVRAVG